MTTMPPVQTSSPGSDSMPHSHDSTAVTAGSSRVSDEYTSGSMCCSWMKDRQSQQSSQQQEFNHNHNHNHRIIEAREANDTDNKAEQEHEANPPESARQRLSTECGLQSVRLSAIPGGGPSEEAVVLIGETQQPAGQAALQLQHQEGHAGNHSNHQSSGRSVLSSDMRTVSQLQTLNES